MVRSSGPPEQRLALIAAAVLAFLSGCSADRLPSTPPASGTSALTPSAATSGELPGPPPDFDPADVLWVGDLATGTSSIGSDGGVWVGTLAGNAVRMSATHGGGLRSVADGRVFFQGPTDPTGYLPSIWMVEPGAEPRLLGYGGFGYAVASAARFVVAETQDAAISTGLWALPFDGGKPRLLMPPGPTVRSRHAVSDDGALVASGGCPDHMTDGHGIDMLGGGKVVNLGIGKSDPIGFDLAGRLVFREFCGPNGRILRLEQDGSSTDLISEANQARVTRDGRHLIALDQDEMRLHLVDLKTPDGRSIPLSGESWSLTMLGDNEFAVLENYFPAEKAWRPLVVSLDKGWMGLLPTLAR